MVIFPSTSVEARALHRRNAALLLALLTLGTGSLLRAGNLVTLTNGAEVDGKLSFAGANVHAEAESSPPDTPVGDVLEATFSDTPFSLHVFRAGDISKLPPNWTAQDIGQVVTPGSVTVQSGTFTVTGSIVDRKGHDHSTDHLYFVGTPWPDNGQFTTRMTSLTVKGEGSWVGVLFRDSLDPTAAGCSAVLNPQGQIRMSTRREAGRGDEAAVNLAEAPIWLRLTREGNTVLTSTSTDGNSWDIVNFSPFKTLTNPLVGMTARNALDKDDATAVFDNVSITPLPSSAQTLPAGLLLQGGSLLAGQVMRLSLDPSTPDANGEFLHGDKHLALSRSSVAAVVTLPIERSQLDALDSKPGLLMRNGDTTDGDITEIDMNQITVSSVLLGISNYKPTETRACFLAPMQAKPATYEVRLRDGSILNASAVTGDASGVVITDVSGMSIQADINEVAQIRAGNALVQNLAQVAWKATGPAAPAAPVAPAAAAPSPFPDANTPANAAANPAAGAAANNAAPAAAPPPVAPLPLVDTWLGPDQQQVLEAGMNTALTFPLLGKFRALGVQVALSSDSPPNATATIRILINGQELAKSPPFHAGDPPRFLEVTLPTASSITFQAESMFPDVKVLYLDPVAIR